MSRSRSSLSPRRKTFLALAGSIESQLREAYAKKFVSEKLSQTALAEKLGVGRSVVSRRLSGAQNMTVESIADLVWALDHCIKVVVFDPKETNNNHEIAVFLGSDQVSDTKSPSIPVKRSAGSWDSTNSRISLSGSVYEPA